MSIAILLSYIDFSKINLMFPYFSVANKPSLEDKNPQTEIFFDDNTKKDKMP